MKFLYLFFTQWNKDGWKKYSANAGWLFLARVVSFTTSFLTVAIVARYLGPENLGKLSYAQSMIAIASVVASLGINQIVFRELVKRPEEESLIIGTAIITRLFAGTIALILSVLVSLILGNEQLLTLLIGIMGLTFIVNPVSTVGLLFGAQVKSKYTSYVSITSAILIPLFKIVLVLRGEGIIFFAGVFVVEALISVIFSLYIYRTYFSSHGLNWQWQWREAKALLLQAWPLLFASVSTYIYGKMDQIMLLHFLDASAVGLYSVVVQLREIAILVPGIFMGSVLPALINVRLHDTLDYYRRWRYLFVGSIGIVTSLAVLISLGNAAIIRILFGEEFLPAVPILQIFIWTSVFSIIIQLTRQLLIIEERTHMYLVSTVIGITANLALNYTLIPRFGAEGAAYATLITLVIVLLSLLTSSVVRRNIAGMLGRHA